MSARPLIADFSSDAPFAWRRGRLITQGIFLAQARAAAERLPQSRYVINACTDRYKFTLGLAAACLRRSTTLLLPGAGAQPAEFLGETARESHWLDDAGVDEPALSPAREVDSIPDDFVVATLYTSGSTGVPQPHEKRWRTLAETARLASNRLLGGRRLQIVATVPPQHMYGLETTVMMALGAGCVMHDGRPSFPADVVEALHEVPAPRVLITTPFHLRALVETRQSVPDLDLIVSATAPLREDLARQAEDVLHTRVFEIYGCTEAGSMATRRTIAGELWQPYEGVTFEPFDGVTRVTGRHLPEPVRVSDITEVEPDGRIRLLGRDADMIKIAGRRASLAELTQHLLAIPGVEDGVVFAAGDGEAARPAALVVAPTLSESQVRAELGKRVDPIVLPRPIRKVTSLPRNPLGKLPRTALLSMLRSS